jgi:hypothetical protein
MPAEHYDYGLTDWRPPSAEPEPERTTRTTSAPRSRRARRKRPSLSRRRGTLAAIGLAVVALAGTLALSPVQTVLKQSFTRLPQPYATIYFTSDPTIDGAALHVPLTVESADTPHGDYGLNVWTVNAAGAVSGKASAKVTTHGATAATTVVTMTVTPDASVVWVSLNGTQQTLHYRIGRT